MKIKNLKYNQEGVKRIKRGYTLAGSSHFKSVVNSTFFKTILTALTSFSFFLTGCNRAIADLKYGQNSALFIGDDAAIVLDIKDWKDYEGEQYQIRATNGLTMLTASFDTDLFFGNNTTHSATEFANNSVSEEGEVYDFSNNNTSIFNYELLDLNWKYNKAVLFNKNKAAMLHINQWRDYEGEQLQVVTNERMAVLLSSYNSKLFYDKQSNMKAEDFAKMYTGSDGELTVIGAEIETNNLFNYDIFDFQFRFNKVIIFKDNKAIILPVSQWKDYEGEQLQIKVLNGPTILTAAYDSILVDDTYSTTSAYDLAIGIADEVIDLTVGKKLNDNFYNKTIIDLVYGFGNGVISNDNSATSIPIKNWNDYEGEQLQVIFPNEDVMLTSSIFLDMINDGTNDLNANSLADYYSVSKVIHNATNLTSHIRFNKQLIDLKMGFNYALHVENGNVTIIPLSRWKDYYNSNGQKSSNSNEAPSDSSNEKESNQAAKSRNNEYDEEEEASPNCEQLQLELPDGTVILTTAYDTIIIKTSGNIKDYAEMFRGANGIITDLTPIFGEPVPKGWNLTIIDTKWKFNYGIYNSGVNSQVFEIKKWIDFNDGEQVQLYFKDDGGFVSSYCNTSLIYTDDEGKVEAIANAFAGIENGRARTHKYYQG